MSKIVPKSVQMLGAQSTSITSVNAEKTADELLFATLFNGAKAVFKGEDVVLVSEDFDEPLANHSQNQEIGENHPSEGAFIGTYR